MRSVIRDNTGDPAPKGVVWDVADVFPGGGGNWGGSYLAVPKSSPHQEQAQEFAAWITAPEQQIQIFEQYGNFPSQVAALEDPALLASSDPYFNEAPVGEIFSNRASAITIQPYHGPLYSDILGKFQEAITRVDQGGDPEESWADVRRRGRSAPVSTQPRVARPGRRPARPRPGTQPGWYGGSGCPAGTCKLSPYLYISPFFILFGLIGLFPLDLHRLPLAARLGPPLLPARRVHRPGELPVRADRPGVPEVAGQHVQHLPDVVGAPGDRRGRRSPRCSTPTSAAGRSGG